MYKVVVNDMKQRENSVVYKVLDDKGNNRRIIL